MKRVSHGPNSESKNEDGVPIEWIAYCESGQKPDDIPDRPDIVYADEWKGWDDFLGTPPPGNQDTDGG